MSNLSPGGLRKKFRTISMSPAQEHDYYTMSKHASNHILTMKMQKEIRSRYRQEIDEMIEDELRYEMIKQAEQDNNNQNKLAAEK